MLQSAITPSLRGRTVLNWEGVRPTISLAWFPTAAISPDRLLKAMIEGSLTTIPFPLANIKVFAVPRSTARSEERKLKKERMLTAILFPDPGVLYFTDPRAIQLPRGSTSEGVVAGCDSDSQRISRKIRQRARLELFGSQRAQPDRMLQAILNTLFRCGHRNLTRPITPRGGGQAYVACLDCGTHLSYDLEAMQVGARIRRQWAATPAVNPTHH
jgi:hypothetical protein